MRCLNMVVDRICVGGFGGSVREVSFDGSDEGC